tara:strand:+ start:250 stop:618 length:369 start_codon:yes stop_codon:yes gene_type:complete
MNVSQKWSSLFHHTIQSEENLNPKKTEEALALIHWMFEEYQEYMKSNDFETDQDLIDEFKLVTTALKQKIRGAKKAEYLWPITIFDKWEDNKPFHSALGTENLKSDWNSIWLIIKDNKPPYK